ncbi:hypothetical protein LX32DRAFT_398715 [Colletotrichum zoysiae]|uniref:Uncharacterized protein n=1 Tax=Colletotrichum zoysiae TaxID=1216348 RepID=A0AAD9HHM2_9PEZI|nr:hypothetical protein LX32DRAFT_398715 [Colletotrichum zoysiae]
MSLSCPPPIFPRVAYLQSRIFGHAQRSAANSQVTRRWSRVDLSLLSVTKVTKVNTTTPPPSSSLYILSTHQAPSQHTYLFFVIIPSFASIRHHFSSLFVGHPPIAFIVRIPSREEDMKKKKKKGVSRRRSAYTPPLAHFPGAIKDVRQRKGGWGKEKRKKKTMDGCPVRGADMILDTCPTTC